MATQYTKWEQERIDALQELDDARRRREYVNPHLYERAQREAQLAEHNAACRAERQAQLAAQEVVKRQADEAAQQRAIQEQIDVFKRQARARFMGSDVEFARQWPSILDEWRQRQALGVGNPELDRARAELRALAPGRYDQF